MPRLRLNLSEQALAALLEGHDLGCLEGCTQSQDGGSHELGKSNGVGDGIQVLGEEVERLSHHALLIDPLARVRRGDLDHDGKVYWPLGLRRLGTVAEL